MTDCHCPIKHELKMVRVLPSPGSDRTEDEIWPECMLMFYGGNPIFAVPVEWKGTRQEYLNQPGFCCCDAWPHDPADKCRNASDNE